MSGARGETLLLVEDDTLLRTRLCEAFRDRGFDCFVAESVQRGAELLRERRPAKLVTDLRLGDGSGLELLKCALDLGGSTECVVLSGYGTIATAVEAVKLGARNFVTKPAHADAILEAFKVHTPGPPPASSRVPSLEQVEWEHLSRVMKDHQGNVSKAAEALGMHRRTLQRKLAKMPGGLR